jgi:hypothetical protein
MACPVCPDACDFADRRRGPVSLWAPLAIIAIVLGAASLASATVKDPRDPAARQAAAPMSRAL